MSTSSEDGPLVSSESGGSGGITGAAEATTGCESLACVSCRARKLKCDRQIPVCVRCVKSGGECVYPESRRKPATKRRNVKELEDRLAQVEGLLKGVIRQPVSPDATTQPNNQNPARASVVDEAADSSSDKFPCNDPRQDSASEGYAASRPPADNPETVDNPFQSDELLGLGRFEALPPLELIEELHDIFFKTQKYFIHVIHQGNYLRSFYNSAPHMRPPMALQYAIWTTAAHGHDKYGGYHDIFYQRTRQYLQADELKGCGEHFITIAHAQAWAFIAIDEGRSMLFTRVAMSSARLIRLVQMMELHRLDGPPIEADDSRMAPPLAAPQTWTELEERRRLFWGAYCIDSHASISTGWPSLIDIDEVTTKLPASEDAFSSGIEENSSTLQDVFRGGGYSTFGASVCACLIFNLLMKHVHRPMPGDRPDDVSHGPFWKNHRDIDNILSNAFMFLPERFRLPSNLKDPIAVHTNLNLHASVICLHNAACDKADKFNLPSHIKQASKTRSLAAAHEIVRIMKSTSSTTQEHKNPLLALSLYCAAVVFIAAAKETPQDFATENLDFIIERMGSISREHVIKRAYYNQLLLDIKHSGIGAYLTIPEALYADESLDEYCLPVLARTSVSHRPAMDPRPFSKRTTDTFVAKGYYLWPGTILTAEKAARSRLRPSKNPDENPACTSIIGNRGCDEPRTAVDDPEAPSSKRKRTVPGQGPRPAPALSNTVNANTGPSEPPAKTFNTHFFQREDWFAVCDDKMTQFSNTKRLMGDNWPAMLANTRHIDLVDRTGSAAAQQPGANRRPIADSTMAGQGTQIYPQPPVFASALVGAGETSTSFLAELMPDTTTDSSGEHILMDGHLDVQVQDLNSILPGMEQWDMTEQATLYMPGFDGPADGTDHWMLLAEGVGVGSAGASWDEGGGGGGDRGGSG